MRKLSGSSFLVLGAILIVFGILLRGGLVDWLIDVTGLILLILGVILALIGILRLFSRKSRRSY